MHRAGWCRHRELSERAVWLLGVRLGCAESEERVAALERLRKLQGSPNLAGECRDKAANVRRAIDDMLHHIACSARLSGWLWL